MKLREQAYESFTRHLLSLNIRPGQFISQRELVELTGHPLGAIRELIPRLEADGLIKTAPQRGMQVAHIDLALIRNAFQLRMILEREAVEHFAAKAPVAEIERLEAAHRTILALTTKPMNLTDLDTAQSVDRDLHDTLIDFLGNSIISDIYRVNSIKIRLIRQERIRLTPDNTAPVMREHLAIIEALKARAPERAASALVAHLTAAKARALGV